MSGPRPVPADVAVPYDLDVEQAVLGSPIVAPERFPAVKAILQELPDSEDAFWSHLHRRVWRRLCWLHDTGRQIDLVELVHAMREAGELTGAADLVRVQRLVDGVHRSANVEHHARTLVELARQRAECDGGAADAPAEALPEGMRSELARAQAFVLEHGRDLRFVVAWRRWLRWVGTHWQPDATGEARRLAKRSARDETVRALAGGDTRAVREALGGESARAIDAVLTLASTEAGVAIEPAAVDVDPWLLNVQNGTLDLRTGQLRPHRRGDLLTKLVPYPYDPSAPGPLWGRFLERVLPDADVRAFVQRFLGYALTGRVGEHLLVFFYGTGRNGKSTLLMVVLRILSEYGVQAPPGLLLAIGERDHPTAITTLYGRRLAVAMEAGEGRRFREELVKQLTGGDRVSARRMREDFWEFDPTHKIILAANHRPDIRGTDVAIWSRIALVPFTVTIPEEERDPDLPDKLMQEGPGILAWLVKGCREWQRIGLAPPDAVRGATEAYRQAADPIGDFIDDRCIKYEAAKVTKGVIYGAYVEWARKRGEEPLTQRAFGERMFERGFEEGKEGKDRTRIWIGVGLMAEANG